MGEKVGTPPRRLMREWGSWDMVHVRALREIEEIEAEKDRLDALHKR